MRAPTIDGGTRRRRAGILVAAAAAFAVCYALGTGYDYAPSGVEPTLTAPDAVDADALRENRRLRTALARHTPREVYLVVDRANNRLYLRRGETTLLEALCSSGSGTVLHAPDGRSWRFDTPSGLFRVRSKTANPVWRRPDWAFVEEGLPLPGRPEDRFEYGSLGEYALHFGDGYLIHGTLYERLLGRSVTHGCIRLGRDDLRRVYDAAKLGTPVYIF
ncbi:MAG TPA: L,D-transpeptidase [Candidatus Polarisedimenticolaceae bacterium]|nr:L,D-transpeptidase [Candidatus Polarisedimenticolaceae bacterium]